MSPIGAFKNEVLKQQLPSSSENKTAQDFSSSYKNIDYELSKQMSPPITKCMGGGFNKTQGQFSVSKQVKNLREVDFESGTTGFINCIGNKIQQNQSTPFNTVNVKLAYTSLISRCPAHQEEATVRNFTQEQVSLDDTAVLKDQESVNIDDQYPKISTSEKKKRHTTNKFQSDVSIAVGAKNT